MLKINKKQCEKALPGSFNYNNRRLFVLWKQKALLLEHYLRFVTKKYDITFIKNCPITEKFFITELIILKAVIQAVIA